MSESTDSLTAQQPIRTAIFTHRVSDCLAEHSAIVSINSTPQQVVELMTEKTISSVLVCDDEQQLIGIITEQDIVRRYTNSPKDKQLADIMTSKVLYIRERAHLFKAVGMMLKNKLQHLPVIDSKNRPKGTIRLANALTFSTQRMIDEVQSLTQTNTPEGLKISKQSQLQLVLNLQTEGLASNQIQKVISRLNNDLYQEAQQIVEDSMLADGWGAPPVDYALIIMGSGGRGESFFHPDQDNGYIIEDYPLKQHNTIDKWFTESAERLVNLLDTVGFTLCTGYIMANNPIWRKPISEWKTQVKGWFNRNTIYAEMFADVLLDFRCVAGNSKLATQLKQFIAKEITDHPGFLGHLFQYDQSTVPLGWFNRLITEKHNQENQGTINLKGSMIVPLIHCLRLLCLKHGITKISSLARIQALAKKGIITKELSERLSYAFRHICNLTFNLQIQQIQNNDQTSYRLNPKTLTMFERELLIQSLLAVKEFKRITQEIFTGRLM